MRFRHPDGTLVHLAYCTNVHPAEDLDGVLAQLARYAEPVRERLGAGTLGVGLWLAADVARALADETALARLRRELDARGLEVVTLNGFPYRAFHAPVVKRAVYVPDWTERARLDYTLDLARVLQRLLPDDVARGSISTLPLGWRTPWPAERDDAARRRLDLLARELARLDRPVRAAIEPEPGCVIETTGRLRRTLDQVDPEWIGSCLDLCHLAVGFEDPAAAVAAAAPVVKAQVSAALQADDPADPETRRALGAFAEPRFLHQTRASDGRSWDDLDEALAAGGPGPWRVHFHIPLHAKPEPPLATAHDTLVDTLGVLLGGPAALVDHLEVETYTWDVLPAELRPGEARTLVDGIADELAWTRDRLLALGLHEVIS
ncbi:metabolite traffic protein EboE [Actinoallomurus sp. NBC_01490]|uniref:metabolite traffic protein EboE n=1 Tax=Actinoallomurus sp. NBC_01490 TaxID=2903557 RepID=UPI002E36E19A|nr:metabolite traffic protein EboE [Actinoallomurus sp. NBC_01490]